MVKKSKFRLILCCILLSCNLIFIWGNSLLPGEISGAFSDLVRDGIQKLMDLLLGPRPEKPPGGGGLLRKLAHFTEFTFLGLCLSWLIRMVRSKSAEHIVYPLLGGFTAACIDETIQLFVPLRGPAIKDVGIDTAGVVLGVAIITLIQMIKNKKGKYLEETL